ncbi:MAG: sulfite exporter TauE/SafE family protein [Flavobacteriales bacterium]|nr:sulfite exporter TauE/SafE family protein [Flavobacteriales bacterium]
MNNLSYLLFFFLALISEIIGTIGGFGSSVFFVPMAEWFFDFKTVLCITGLMHVFSNSSKLILFRRHIEWKLFLKIGLPSIVLVIIGAWLSQYIQIEHADLYLGIFLIVLSVVLLILPKIKIAPTLINSITGGSIAGFTAGLMGTGGAIRGIVLSAFKLEKNVFIATSAAIDMGVDISRTIIYLWIYYLNFKLIWIIPVLLIISFIGSWIGKLILHHIPQKIFQLIVLILILIIGIASLLRHYIDL